MDETTCSTNQTNYEALIMELEMLIRLQAHAVDIFGDYQLVVNHMKGFSNIKVQACYHIMLL